MAKSTAQPLRADPAPKRGRGRPRTTPLTPEQVLATVRTLMHQSEETIDKAFALHVTRLVETVGKRLDAARAPETPNAQTTVTIFLTEVEYQPFTTSFEGGKTVKVSREPGISLPVDHRGHALLTQAECGRLARALLALAAPPAVQG